MSVFVGRAGVARGHHQIDVIDPFRVSVAQDSADERFVVVNDRQADGVQAGHRRIENLATAERHKSLAEDCRRCQIQRRHRGPRSAGKPRRLIAPRHLKSLIAHRKNDQAFVEQKNGAIVRKIVGYRRFEGLQATRRSRLHQIPQSATHLK